MTSEMKNKRLIARQPTCDKLACGGGRKEGSRKKCKKKKFKCICPCSDSIKELSEQRIHNTRVRGYCTKCLHVCTQTHTFCMTTHIHAHAHICAMKPQQDSEWILFETDGILKEDIKLLFKMN